KIIERLNAKLARFATFRERIGNALRRLRGRRLRQLWTKLVYNENFGALRLKPEWRNGQSGTRILDEAERLLLDLVDVDTGAPAISAVTRPSAEAAGKRATALPDLLLHYPPNAFPRAVFSAALGHIEAAPPRFRPGNHASGGLLVA